MAKTKNNIYMSGLSGTIGKQMTLSVKKNDTIVGKKRVPTNIPASDEQIDVRDRFTDASSYALAAMADPIAKRAYAAAAKADPRNVSAYNLALKDAFSAPDIQRIITKDYHGQAGDVITTRARDVLKLTSVHVAVYTADNVLVEEGPAVAAGNIEWKYTATRQNPATPGSVVRITAVDLPGNEAVREALIA